MPLTFVTGDEIQAWLEPSKLLIDPLDAQLIEREAHQAAWVFGRLAGVYDTTGWVDQITTPKLVRTIISGFTAAYHYNSFYSETEDAGNPYADRIIRQLMILLDQLVNGLVVLTDDPQTPESNPIFWPTDDTGRRQVRNALGKVIQKEGSQDYQFRMGQVF